MFDQYSIGEGAMITKRQLSTWASLKNRSERDSTGLFLVEGRKLVQEVHAAGWRLEAWLSLRPATSEDPDCFATVTEEQMQRVSGFRTVPSDLAVVHKPVIWSPLRWEGGWTLLLDNLQDPGNLGTLIRTAAWFGISQIIASPDTADLYQPKVLQASMGAFLRVHYGVRNLVEFVAALPPQTAVLGTFLEGQSIFSADLPSEGCLIFGNEGHGISADLQATITQRLTIPRFGQGVESLNVSAAAAIVCAQLRSVKR